MSLPKPRKVTKVVSHPALPYAQIGAFLAEVRTLPMVSALALELLILTATRTSEVLNAKWSEFDLKAAMWTIPGERMKAGREHRVPLSDAALAALEKAKAWGGAEYVFPGQKADTPLSNMALLALLKRMKRSDLTVHGFRSTFRDWVAERTAYPNEVAEMALAHTIENKAEAAYRRGDLFDKRIRMMSDWAAFASRPAASADVFQIRGAVLA